MYLMGAPPRINPVNMDQQHQEVLVIETDDPVLLHLAPGTCSATGHLALTPEGQLGEEICVL